VQGNFEKNAKKARKKPFSAKKSPQSRGKSQEKIKKCKNSTLTVCICPSSGLLQRFKQKAVKCCLLVITITDLYARAI